MRKHSMHTYAISHDQILSRYWDLANLTPEETKGSIAGQLKALDSLCEEHARTSGDTAKKPLPAASIYRSRWMTEPGLEN